MNEIYQPSNFKQDKKCDTGFYFTLIILAANAPSI